MNPIADLITSPRHAFRPLEVLSLVTPLGVRFWDAVTGTFVADGLDVIAYPTDAPARRVAATQNRSGVYLLRGLPGLRAAENGAGDDAYWTAPPVRRAFTIEVTDRSGRFIPFRLEVTAPARGLLEMPGVPPVASPPPSVSAVPAGAIALFSAASRLTPAGVGVVRSELWDAERSAPAAGAVLSIEVGDGPAAWGVADERGRVAVPFGYPEPPQLFFATSPPPTHPVPLTQQSWPARVSAFYSRPTDEPEPADGRARPPPDLVAAFAQAEAVLLVRRAPNVALGEQAVIYGRELSLRTEGQSVLHISPAP